jgi:cbb3-type cytochrome oxidase subunit 1
MGTVAKTEYNYGIVRLFTVAAIFWGIAGFLVGAGYSFTNGLSRT